MLCRDRGRYHEPWSSRCHGIDIDIDIGVLCCAALVDHVDNRTFHGACGSVRACASAEIARLDEVGRRSAGGALDCFRR